MANAVKDVRKWFSINALEDEVFPKIFITDVYPQKDETFITFVAAGETHTVSGKYKGVWGVDFSTEAEHFSPFSLMVKLIGCLIEDEEQKEKLNKTADALKNKKEIEILFLSYLDKEMAKCLAQKIQKLVKVSSIVFTSIEKKRGNISLEYRVEGKKFSCQLGYFLQEHGYVLNIIEHRGAKTIYDEMDDFFRQAAKQIKQEPETAEFFLDRYAFGIPRRIYLETMKELIRGSKEYKLKKLFDLSLNIL